jgi:hypothetical protein
MCAYDAVAQKDFYPHLPDLPVEMDEDEETIKIVQLVKSNEPLVSSFRFLFFRWICLNISFGFMIILLLLIFPTKTMIFFYQLY